MQAQTWFNQQLPALQQVLLPPQPFFEGGVTVDVGGFSGGVDAASAAGTGGSAGTAGAVSAGDPLS